MSLQRDDISQLEAQENPFAMSIGDLMAGLMMIFVLILVLASSQARKAEQTNQKITDQVSVINTQYENLKRELYEALADSFPQSKLEEWEAEIDSEDLTIRFNNSSVLFATGRSEVRPPFQAILSDFWPTFINVLYQDQFRGRIEEVRIEGHTSTFWRECGTDEACAYLANMELSQNRTRSVLEYVITRLPTPEEKRNWIKGQVTANGLSFSKPRPGVRAEQNQRVEFRVRTDAESVLEGMIEDILQITTEPGD